jgi:hypothetical protein
MGAHDHLRVAWKAAFLDLCAEGQILGLTGDEIQEIMHECKDACRIPKKRGAPEKIEDEDAVDEIISLLRWPALCDRPLSKSAATLMLAQRQGNKRGEPETYRITLLRKLNRRIREAPAKVAEKLKADE